MGAAPALGVPAPIDEAFTETLQLTARSRLVISTTGNLSSWWTRVERLRRDGSWQVDPSPGLRLEDVHVDQYRDLLEARLLRAGALPPAVPLIALAERHEWDARTGDPDALVIARVLQALAYALRDDPEVATEFLNFAHAYMLQRRPRSVPLGSGDPRIKRSGRRPVAAHWLLRCAELAMRALPARRRGGPTEEELGAYLDEAEEIAWVVEHLYPAIYPRGHVAQEEAVKVLAEALRAMTKRAPETIAKAALRACGMSSRQASDTFGFLDKKTKRKAAAEPHASRAPAAAAERSR
ncbi:MAG: hypothetical protein JWM10_2458 [Myxococcaceae bacterium]|nr:hypothetical protein [Myxococcaceae bacterium]